MSEKKDTYAEGYRQGYEDAMSWVINKILDEVEGARLKSQHDEDEEGLV